MNFDYDAFISYAHLDNEPLRKGTDGWVTNLHKFLEKRVPSKMGRAVKIFRDPELKGNDVFSEKLIARLRSAATLVAVVSECFINSDWTKKELHEFCKAVKEQNIPMGEMSRILKVMKSDIAKENQPPELDSILGTEFYRTDQGTKRAREFDPEFGHDAEVDFYSRAEDLAHDISDVLKKIKGFSVPTSQGCNVYLAQTTFDLKDQRDSIRRDLLEHGHTVFPALELPLVASELAEAVRVDLAKCKLSIHLIGKNYSLVPEGETQSLSLSEIQNELAIQRAEQGGFSRLIWIPSDLEIKDEKQQKFIERLRMDTRVQKSADLLETPLESLKTEIRKTLEKYLKKPETRPSTSPKEDISQLYLIYDQRDAAVTPPYADYLFNKGFEVIRPIFEGDEAEVREYNEENLRSCDGALMLYGAASEKWLRGKFKEVDKSVGYGRTKPKPVVAVALMPPKMVEKREFSNTLGGFRDPAMERLFT